MEFELLKKERRSCRSYQEGVITKETLSQIIEDARLAPSWKNSQTARFYAVLDKEKVENFRNSFLPDFNINSTKNCSCYLVCTFEKNISGFSSTGAQANAPGNEWGAYDLGCAISYLILSAKEKGIDSLIMGLYNEEELRKYFSIPNTQEVMGVLALGYKKDDLVFRARKTPDEILVIK